MSFNRFKLKTEDDCHYVKNEYNSSYDVESPKLSSSDEDIMVHHNNIDSNQPYFIKKDLNTMCKKLINNLQVDTEIKNDKTKKKYELNNSEPLMNFLKEEPGDINSYEISNDSVFKEENLSPNNLRLKIEYDDKIIKIEKDELDNNVFESEIEKNEMFTILNEYKYNTINDCELSGLPIKNELIHNSNIIKKNKSKCENPIYICDLCHQSFKSKRKISSHLKNMHSLNHCFSNNLSKNICQKRSKHKLKKNSIKKSFKCKVCFKQFSDQSNCNRHMKNHCHMRNNIYLNEKKFKCNICKKTFSRESNLKVHSRIHTGETPYNCEFCGLKFHRNDTLKAHKRIHEKKHIDFHCSECSKHFSYNSTLLRHVKMKHQNKNPYGCGDCQHPFYRKHSLIVHLRSKHTGERPYKCDICEKSYMEKKVLINHKKSH